jgi:ATP-dependent Clp protease ATP-binding subunit ClpB
VLFDEIEKAHPDVFNILLQILDDGRLTDGQGRTVDLKNTVLIMTSNVGSQVIQELTGKPDEMRGRVMEALRAHFRPEFLNRIDDVIIFHALSLEQIKKVVDIQLARLQRRLEDRKITLEISDAAKSHLAQAGYDPVYGARPLKRTIQRELQDPLALRLLEGDFKEGDRIEVDFGDGKLTLEPAAAEAGAPPTAAATSRTTRR